METPTKKRKKILPTTPKKINKTEKSKEHFDFVGNENGKLVYNCHHCERNINGTNSSNLSSHLKVHRDIYLDICGLKESIEYKRQKLLLDCIEVVGVNGRSFRVLNDSGIVSMNENLLEELKKAGREFNLSDPNLKEVKDGLKDIAEKIRQKISNEVKNRGISLLIDIVTKRGRSLLGVSVQYRVNGTLHTRSIGMINLEERHTGIYLANLILKRLEELGIDIKQIITITTDNGSNVLKTVRDLESHLKHIVAERQSMHETDDDDCIEREIEDILAADEDYEDENDQLLELVFDEANQFDDEEENNDLTEREIQANDNLLAAIQLNMTNNLGVDVVWDVGGINCAEHTLQLAISDSLGKLSKRNQNIMKLCRRFVNFMRNHTTMCTLKEANIQYKKPRKDVATRWGSLYLMVNSNLLIIFFKL